MKSLKIIHKQVKFLMRKFSKQKIKYEFKYNEKWKRFYVNGKYQHLN